MLCFLSGLPSIGWGRLQNRENPRLLGTDKENTVLIPASDVYKQWALKMSKYVPRFVCRLSSLCMLNVLRAHTRRYQIGVDVFLFPEGYIDVASLNDLPHYTGGEVSSATAIIRCLRC